LFLAPKNFEELKQKFTHLDVEIDETIELGDFKITWQNGYLEKDTAKIWQQIEGLFDNHFGKTINNNEINNNKQEEV
jgi:flagellar biosynthesis/type III secretory pathway protein FliH